MSSAVPFAPDRTAPQDGAPDAVADTVQDGAHGIIAGRVRDITPRVARRALGMGVLVLIVIAAVIIGIRAGAVDLIVRQIVLALLGQGDATTRMIVVELRLARVMQALLVGSALSVSGAVFQGLLRNPLAEPYVLGVSSGAAVGAVGAIVTGVALRFVWMLPLSAFAGALLAVVLVLRIATTAGQALDSRVMLLSGVVVGAFFNAFILLMLTYADLESFRTAVFWMMGSNAGATWRGVGGLGAAVAAGSLLFFSLARPLNLLAIGEDTAAFLGVSPERTKWIGFAGAALLAAGAVSVSGVIGFVGLVVPHLVRMVWGSDYRIVIPASALLGGAGLVLTDTLARTIARPMELPIGVMTVLIGGPFFVWLLRRKKAL